MQGVRKRGAIGKNQVNEALFQLKDVSSVKFLPSHILSHTLILSLTCSRPTQFPHALSHSLHALLFHSCTIIPSLQTSLLPSLTSFRFMTRKLCSLSSHISSLLSLSLAPSPSPPLIRSSGSSPYSSKNDSHTVRPRLAASPISWRAASRTRPSAPAPPLPCRGVWGCGLVRWRRGEEHGVKASGRGGGRGRRRGRSFL